MRTLFLSMFMVLGCVPKGAHPLTPLAAGPAAAGSLTYSSAAALDSTPGMGLDLAVSLTVEKLLTNLSKGESADLYVSCRDIAKPIHKVEFKFIASGTGAPGEIVVGWVGLGERL